MNSERIKEIQETTAYPNSVSVQQALFQVWNECEQKKVKNCSLKEAIEMLKKYSAMCNSDLPMAFSRRTLREAIDTVIEALEYPTYTSEEMYLNMQYYMEYCQMKGYVTPMEWLEKHKHFGKEAATRDKASQDKVDFLKSAKQPNPITHPYDLSKK